jgi:hypothetical protein
MAEACFRRLEVASHVSDKRDVNKVMALSNLALFSSYLSTRVLTITSITNRRKHSNALLV